jgi:gamma-D-glutamyl-L-lysine dipeptidyl-peptidase
MSYGICNLSIAPCRKEASDRSEMTTQLLFGEHFQILEETEKWCFIRNAFDGYESWIDKKQMKEISSEEFDQLSLNEFPIAASFISMLVNETNMESNFVLVGSTLPWYGNNRCRIYKDYYTFSGEIADSNTNKIIDNAMPFFNAPYLWGGRSPFGIDCSGFTQVVYKMANIKLPRDANQQANCGEPVLTTAQIKKSDLLFFSNKENKVIHVGIAIDRDYIIHASGKVRIDKIVETGILNTDTNEISHSLHSIRRII